MLMVNLASVLLARGAQREHEFAVSRALGASSGAVIRATVLEGGLLGLAGGAAGTLAAIWATRALVAVAPLDLPRRDAIAVDWRLGAVMILLGVTLGLLAGAAPAVWAARARLSRCSRTAPSAAAAAARAGCAAPWSSSRSRSRSCCSAAAASWCAASIGCSVPTRASMPRAS
jgi:hypothetical protein